MLALQERVMAGRAHMAVGHLAHVLLESDDPRTLVATTTGKVVTPRLVRCARTNVATGHVSSPPLNSRLTGPWPTVFSNWDDDLSLGRKPSHDGPAYARCARSTMWTTIGELSFFDIPEPVPVLDHFFETIHPRPGAGNRVANSIVGCHLAPLQ